ncbi:Class I SAM-dependent methyltransferase [Rhodovastum atsumiense]|uniref:Class I SAM-dependent methyltransferase n=1 Tax=Rhodovastum atsumiense TaxID=504468 RepID=A0A5M6IJX2_9PROT|nr:class I SAM-dependent methyltransferase [Rhodovastum atsumiense]KAA5608566.1 class I SAM-dependent methyltransferase [Rhodovastum atsumiense]CAH2598795.1 Class I SAM-dependent methyltransferase [Rhodovastum atsumiense]
MQVAAAPFLAITAPERIRSTLDLLVTDHCYEPRPDDPLADWVATVAVPAFKALRALAGPAAACASIGTGSGLDMLAAIEILGARRVGITDLHEDVVAAAAANIAGNLAPGHAVTIEAGTGDLLAPLRPQGGYDMIYENLPNTPLRGSSTLETDRTSSKHLAPRPEQLPPLVETQLLALHYLALRQVVPVLAPGGSVLSTIGARVPLGVLLEMAALAGHAAEVLIYTWKHQADPEEMIGGYAAWQQDGLGPFHFYPAAVLREAFADDPPAAAGARALDLEAQLAPHRLDAPAALAALRAGETLAHTVAVLRSRPLPGATAAGDAP